MQDKRLRTWGSLALLVLLAAGVTLAREPNLVRAPPAAYEDGRDMLAFYYNHRGPAAIFRSYAGYTALLPNLAGYLAAALPIERVPLALALFPLAVSSLAFSWLCLPAYRFLLPSDAARFATCLALALWPVGNAYFVGNTTYSVWSLLLLLALVALAPPPSTPVAAAGRLAWTVPLVASHPLSIALVPTWGLSAARDRRPANLFLQGGLTAAAVLYQLVAVTRPETAGPGLLATVRLTAVFVLERVVFATLCGDAAARALRSRGDAAWILAVALAAVVVLAGAWAWVGRRLPLGDHLAAASLVYLVLSLTVLYVVGRSPSEDILAGNRAYRYFWVQRLLFVVLLALVADRLWRRLGAGRRRWAAALSLAAVVWLAVLNFENRRAYALREGPGRRLAAFTAEVAGQEAAGRGVDARLDRGPVWSFELHRAGESR